MPSSAVRNFSDPHDYASSIRATQVQLAVTAPGQFAANLVRIDLHQLWMQRFSTNLPFVAHAANVSGRAIFVFGTRRGPPLLRSGVEVSDGLAWAADGQTSYQRTSGPASWGSMSLPADRLASLGASMAGLDLRAPTNEVMLTPPKEAMARLRRLHAAAGHLAEHAPEILANSAAAHGLEQAFVHAMIGCLAASNRHEDRSAWHRHSLVMRRFHAVVESSEDRPLYLSEICAAIGVSDRMLRTCCQEHLGMGPLRYLWLRRMQLARRALVQAHPKTTTVTDIATANGFWELGRFAVAYRGLYGESPSVTLGRDPHRVPPPRTLA